MWNSTGRKYPPPLDLLSNKPQSGLETMCGWHPTQATPLYSSYLTWLWLLWYSWPHHPSWTFTIYWTLCLCGLNPKSLTEQYVSIGGNNSQSQPVICGVPQVSVHGLILFNIYMLILHRGISPPWNLLPLMTLSHSSGSAPPSVSISHCHLHCLSWPPVSRR